METRWPCPVCLGVRLEKTHVPGSQGLVLDHCVRCGGIWFELGEVARLRAARPRPLWTKIEPLLTPSLRCHSCGAWIARDDEQCVACSWKQVLDCPSCARPLRHDVHGGVKLDMCTHCKGVWFDHGELATLWNVELDAATRRHRISGDVAAAPVEAPLHLIEVLAYSPDLIVYGTYQVGRGMIEVGSAAPEAAAGAIEVAGEAAASVFEVIVGIIGGLFG